jgi:ankyrin repeat protein
MSGFAQQLSDALDSRDWVNLRAILSHEDDGGRPSVMNSDIVKAFEWAAMDHHIEACRILWEKLSMRGKQEYFFGATTGSLGIRSLGNLHQAANWGRIVRFLVEECKVNVNQINRYGDTPLSYAIPQLATSRFLLEHGADPNQGGPYGPLGNAVHQNHTELCRLLLVEYQAKPNLNRKSDDEGDANQVRKLRNTDIAIRNGSTEILRILLEHGAFVGYRILDELNGTSLNVLLRNNQKCRKTKLSICRLLVEHAKEDQATAVCLQVSFKFVIKQTTHNDEAACQILLQAGTVPNKPKV